jgi:hypothetical protein
MQASERVRVGRFLTIAIFFPVHQQAPHRSAAVILKTESCGCRPAPEPILLTCGTDAIFPPQLAADSARAAVGCRLGLPRSAPYFAVQLQKGRSRRVVLQSTKCGADVPTRRRRRQSSPVRNILLSKSAREVVVETKPSRVATIIQRASTPAILYL